MKRTSLSLNPSTFEAAQAALKEKRRKDRRITFSSYVEALILRDLRNTLRAKRINKEAN